MAEIKTKPTKQSVTAFLRSVTDEQRRKDAAEVIELMRTATKCDPVIWGTNIIGFDTYRYTYANGKQGDWPIVGLSPRKQYLVVYIMAGFTEYEALMAKLGKHKTGSSCLYIRRLADIDKNVLKQLIVRSVAAMKKKYKTA